MHHLSRMYCEFLRYGDKLKLNPWHIWIDGSCISASCVMYIYSWFSLLLLLLLCQVPCAVLRDSGDVVTMECVEKLIKPDMRNPISGAKLRDKDIIPLQRVCTVPAVITPLYKQTTTNIFIYSWSICLLCIWCNACLIDETMVFATLYYCRSLRLPQGWFHCCWVCI